MNLKGWAIVAGLSMTPALVAGQSFAFAAGIKLGFDPWQMIPVVALFSFIEGVIVAWLAGTTTKIGFVDRWFARYRTPKSIAFAEKWGVWGGLTAGVAFVGQEPVIIALRALGVSTRRLLLPLAASNAIFSVAWYFVVRFGVIEFIERLTKELSF
jgi:hypothetical protein